MKKIKKLNKYLKKYSQQLIIGSLIPIFLFAFIFSFLKSQGLEEAEYKKSAAQVPPPIEDLIEYIQDLGEWAGGDFATLERELLAKAEPDECFYGIGDPRNLFNPNGIDEDVCIADGGQPKSNQAYVWGLAQADDTLWFGTAPNVHCLVMGTYLGSTTPVETDSYACEFGESQFAIPNGPLPAELGDGRLTKIYSYNTLTQTLEDKTPVLDPLFQQTLGIRSAGALGDVAFLGGPGLTGVNLFAFNSQTGEYLGSYTLPDTNNIRKWLVADDVLYTAVGTEDGGAVLKWTGNLGDPFQFETVGTLDSSGAELELHEGRIFVSTWPGSELAGGDGLAGLYMSPVVPAGGLPASEDEWDKVWQADDYEPDPVTAATYGGGALASFDGYLYWGTMHVPMLSAAAHLGYHGTPGTPEEMLIAMLGTYRAISIFRGSNFDGGDPDVDLLYGMPQLPAYTPAFPPGTGSWQLVDNNMDGAVPMYGTAGINNLFNNYTWTMDVYDDQLYIGTMDWSYLIFGDTLDIFPPDMPFDCESILPGEICDQLEIAYDEFTALIEGNALSGADLFRFPNSNTPGIPESLAGVGNYSNYGIRTMIADDALYLGMANPMNLLTDTNDEKPEGGWELLCLSEDTDDDGIGDFCGDKMVGNPEGFNETQEGTIVTVEQDGTVIFEADMSEGGTFGPNVTINNIPGVYLSIKGMPDSEKYIYFQNVPSAVCVQDMENVTVGSYDTCEDEGEFSIACPGQAIDPTDGDTVTCTIDGSTGIIGPLDFSAAGILAGATPGTGTGGHGGASGLFESEGLFGAPDEEEGPFYIENVPSGQLTLDDVPFLDIEGHFAEDYIIALFLAEVIEGSEYFYPDEPIDRGTIIKWIVKAYRYPVYENFEQPFSDTDIDDPNTKYIHAAKEAGIITGYPDGSFRPEQTINRVEILKMLVSAAKVKLATMLSIDFPDTDSDAWYAQYLNYAVLHGIVSGYEDGLYGPEDEVTKGQAAKMLYMTIKQAR